MNKTLLEAKRLHDLGFAILWIMPGQKRPVQSKWTSGARASWEELTQTFRDDFNVGVRTGTPSKINGFYLAVIDVDIKNPSFEEKAKNKIEELLGDAEVPLVLSGSGGGSRHYYVLTEKPFKMITALKEDGGEICIYSDGRQMVLPPSKTKNVYRWQTPCLNSKSLGVYDFSKLTLQDSKTLTKEVSEKSNITLDFKTEEIDVSWLPISDKIREGILNGVDVTDRSGFLMPAASALLSCGLNQNQVLSVLTDPDTYLGACAYEHAKTKSRKRAAEWIHKYTLAKIVDEKDAGKIFNGIELPPVRKLSQKEMEEMSEEFSDGDWMRYLNRTAKGKIAFTLKNLDLIFTNSSGEGASPFIKDLFANRIMYGADTPWGGKFGEGLEDIDLVLIKRWLADTEFNIEPPTTAILEATSLVAHRMAIHPVRDWLSSLQWDGVSRINTWLKRYCEAEAPEPYLSEVSRKFLLAMVKRIFEPGCQWDYVLVLEGKQGKYKSSIARAIAGDKWFMDNLPDLKDKDAMLNLQGKWLIELPELSNVKRSDYNMVKAYLNRRVDTVRPHYGRLMTDVPRQSVFIGTVNEGQYLKDPTGNRRIWPVYVEMCDVEGLKAVRDQLFAEAVHVYKNTREILMLSPEATTQAEEAQEERRVDDDETEMREALMGFRESEAGRKFNWDKFKSHDLFTGPDAPWGRWGSSPYGAQVAAQILRNMGFSRRKIMGQRIWGSPENGSKRAHECARGRLGADPFTSAPSFNDEIDFM